MTPVTTPHEQSAARGLRVAPPPGGQTDSQPPTPLGLPARPARLRGLPPVSRTLRLTIRQLRDLELLLVGGLAPLGGFMGRADYEGVRDGMRLADGTLFPLPVTLDVGERLGRKLGPDDVLMLQDRSARTVAALEVEDVWRPDRVTEAEAVYGTTSRSHPGVNRLLEGTKPWYVGGRLEGIRLPSHGSVGTLYATPAQLREEFARRGWTRVVAFPARSGPSPGDGERALHAARRLDAKLLVHVAAGPLTPNDPYLMARVRGWQSVIGRFPTGAAALAVAPIAPRLAGPRETVWNALVRRNYGCTHYLVAPQHERVAGADGEELYKPGTYHALLRRCEGELGVRSVPLPTMARIVDDG